MHSLAGYRGRTVVLYFYPRDETPGCTTQACSFQGSVTRKSWPKAPSCSAFREDDADSHGKFRERHRLPFSLLVDDDAAVAARYGAWGEKVLYGRRFQGMTRATFIIGPDGILTRVWKRARPAGHGAAVLKALRESA